MFKEYAEKNVTLDTGIILYKLLEHAGGGQ
jgi:N-acetylmuramoyl-L-alanine amidase